MPRRIYKLNPRHNAHVLTYEEYTKLCRNEWKFYSVQGPKTQFPRETKFAYVEGHEHAGLFRVVPPSPKDSFPRRDNSVMIEDVLPNGTFAIEGYLKGFYVFEWINGSKKPYKKHFFTHKQAEDFITSTQEWRQHKRRESI